MTTTFWGGYGVDVAGKRKAAEAAVRAKYPSLIEGSSGWHHAITNRMRK